MLTFSFYSVFEVKFHKKKTLKMIYVADRDGVGSYGSHNKAGPAERFKDIGDLLQTLKKEFG